MTVKVRFYKKVTVYKNYNTTVKVFVRDHLKQLQGYGKEVDLYIDQYDSEDDAGNREYLTRCMTIPLGYFSSLEYPLHRWYEVRNYKEAQDQMVKCITSYLTDEEKKKE